MLHFLFVWLGLGNASGAQYLFWSGFFGDLVIFTAFFVFIKKHNCHVKKCWRLGHEVKGTGYIACRGHHPDMPEEHVTEHHIRRAWEKTHPR